MGSPSGPSAGGQGQRQPQHSRGTSKPGRGLGMRHSLSHEEDAFLWIQRWMGADGQGSVHYITSPQPQPGSFPAPGLGSHRPSQPQWAHSAGNLLASRDRKSCKLEKRPPAALLISSSALGEGAVGTPSAAQGAGQAPVELSDSSTRHTGCKAHR